jgi:hypothetical protein
MFVALVIQHAKRMRRVISSSVACLTPLCFSTLSYKRNEFREKLITEYKMCVLIFPKLLVKKFILRRFQRDIVINVKTSSPKVPVIFLSDFN